MSDNTSNDDIDMSDHSNSDVPSSQVPTHSQSIGSRRARVEDDDEQDEMELERERSRLRTHSPVHAEQQLPPQPPQSPLQLPRNAVNNPDGATARVSVSRTTMQFTLSMPEQDPFAQVNVIFDGSPVPMTNAPTSDLNPQPVTQEFAFNSGPLPGARVMEAFNQLLASLPSHSVEHQPDERRAKIILQGLEKLSPGLVQRINTIGGIMGSSSDEAGATCAVCWEPLLGEGSFAIEESGNAPGIAATTTSLSSTSERTLQSPTNDLKNVVALPCRHAFHASCLLPWFSRHTTCPTCRFNLDPEDLTWKPPQSQSSGGPNNSGPNLSGGATTTEANGSSSVDRSPVNTQDGVAVNQESHGNTPATSNEPSIPTQRLEWMNSMPPELRTFFTSLFGPNATPLNVPSTSSVNLAPAAHSPSSRDLHSTVDTQATPNLNSMSSSLASQPHTATQHGDASSPQANGNGNSPGTPSAAIAFIRSMASATASPIPMTVNSIGMMPSLNMTAGMARPDGPSNGTPSAPSAMSSGLPPNTEPAGPGSAIAAYLQNLMRSGLMNPLQLNAGNSSMPNVSQNAGATVHPPSVNTQTANTAAPADGASIQANASSGHTYTPNQADNASTLNDNSPHDGPLLPDANGSLFDALLNSPMFPANSTASNGMPGEARNSLPGMGTPFIVPGGGITFPPQLFAVPTAAIADGLPPQGADGFAQSFSIPMYIDDTGAVHPIGLPHMHPVTPIRISNQHVNQNSEGLPAQLPPWHTFFDMMSGQQEPAGHRQRPRKKWLVPEGRGASIRQRVEDKEREVGLRCYDPSCGYGPTDEVPIAPVKQDDRVLISKDGEEAASNIHACEHGLHPGCLVTAARIAGFGPQGHDKPNTPSGGAEKAVEEDVEVSCPVCRAQGHVRRQVWEQGVRELIQS